MERPPRLLRYLAYNCLAGMAAGWIAALALFVLDVFGLGTLALNVQAEPVAILILMFFFGLTFGGLSMAVAVMALSDKPGLIPDFVRRHYQRMAGELKPPT